MNDESDFPDFGDDVDYILDFSIEDIYLLYHCVQETIRTWPGHPRRPAEEQEHLWQMRDNLYRAILDHKFKYMSMDGDDDCGNS